MPALTNRKHETFVENYLNSGRNVRKASSLSGYSYAYGLKLIKEAHLLARVAELDKGAAIAREAREQRVIEEMASIAFTNLTDVVEINDNGELVIKDLDSLPVAAKRALKKVTARKRTLKNQGKSGETVIDYELTVELHDKDKALDKLAKCLDMYKAGKVPGGGTGVFRGLQLITSKAGANGEQKVNGE